VQDHQGTAVVLVITDIETFQLLVLLGKDFQAVREYVSINKVKTYTQPEVAEVLVDQVAAVQITPMTEKLVTAALVPPTIF
jgi:hypothetical protein